MNGDSKVYSHKGISMRLQFQYTTIIEHNLSTSEMQFLWKYSAEVVIKMLNRFTEWKSMNNNGVDCETRIVILYALSFRIEMCNLSQNKIIDIFFFFCE